MTHTQERAGAWAALILLGNKREIRTGIEEVIALNRMELLSVIKSIEFVNTYLPGASLHIHSDSQYVCTLPDRLPRLKQNSFLARDLRWWNIYFRPWPKAKPSSFNYE